MRYPRQFLRKRRIKTKEKIVYTQRGSLIQLGQGILEWMKCRSYQFKFFKGCLPQILLGPILNTLSHLSPMLQFYIRGYLYTAFKGYRNVKRKTNGLI